MALFEDAHVLHRLEPYLAAQEAQSKAQSKRASAPRKLEEADRMRIVKVYGEAQAAGSVYGVIKRLAAHYNVTPAAIRNVLKKVSSTE